MANTTHKKRAYRTHVYWRLATSSTDTDYRLIGGATDIQYASGEADELDVTDHGSADGVRDFIPGLITPGDFTMSLNLWLNTLDTPGTGSSVGNGSQADLLDAVGSETDYTFYVVFPPTGASGTAPATPNTEVPGLTGNGRIKSFDISAPLDDKLTAELTVARTTQWTLVRADV